MAEQTEQTLQLSDPKVAKIAKMLMEPETIEVMKLLVKGTVELDNRKIADIFKTLDNNKYSKNVCGRLVTVLEKSGRYQMKDLVGLNIVEFKYMSNVGPKSIRMLEEMWIETGNVIINGILC